MHGVDTVCGNKRSELLGVLIAEHIERDISEWGNHCIYTTRIVIIVINALFSPVVIVLPNSQTTYKKTWIAKYEYAELPQSGMHRVAAAKQAAVAFLNTQLERIRTHHNFYSVSYPLSQLYALFLFSLSISFFWIAWETAHYIAEAKVLLIIIIVAVPCRTCRTSFSFEVCVLRVGYVDVRSTQ